MLVPLLFGILISLAAADDSIFKPFLLNNVFRDSKMPRSYAVEPPNYFDKIPEEDRPHFYNKSFKIPQCGGDVVTAERMNRYTFQSETLLTALGLEIYDAATWMIALSLQGEAAVAAEYMTKVLVGHRTIQFKDIRGDAPCKGVMAWGECTDPDSAGVCGFCYGDSADKTLASNNAYFFRMISDYWCIMGTTDARCPDRHQCWIWNDYKPVLGENAWANILGPLHLAMARYKNATSIPDDDAAFVLAIPFLDALEKMKVGATGGFYYTPRNTWFSFDDVDVGATISIENQGSLLGSLKMLHAVIKRKGTSSSHAGQLKRIAEYIAGLEQFILSAYSKELGYFRQGATYDHKTRKLDWSQEGQPTFAVDCQTWVATVLGTKAIDHALGKGTAYSIWQKTKELGQFKCTDGSLCGVGFSFNAKDQVLSGEWTYGAINWLRVMIADSAYDAKKLEGLKEDIHGMQMGLLTYVVTSTPLGNSTEHYDCVKYSDKRYFIPFGWFANPLPSLASTSWAVMIEMKYNPFHVDGVYDAPAMN